MPNRLAHETSPYLLQHKDNPVDWYPWGPEAIQRAKAEDKPIFLSIGYSACHWCHVMEHESFENAEIAALLNHSFVCIKVDREERPDLDQIYMNAVQMMTQHGGWPMSVFLTPDLRPFYGGTYWPPYPRMGMPGFAQIVVALAEAWTERRDAAEDTAARLTEALQPDAEHPQGGVVSRELLQEAGARLRRMFDFTHGGFGGKPKFPQPMTLQFLLRLWRRSGSDEPLNMVRLTLDKMARGGIYDHLAGGFARYSVDEHWLVPHFEKMLYDNALLAGAYLDGYLATRNPEYARVVRETCDYVRHYMTDATGGFHSTEDADSEGEEGKFYVWTPEEIRQVLGEQRGERFCYVYDVPDAGNFEHGKSILNLPKSVAQCAAIKGWDLASLEDELADARQTLLAVRDGRVRPAKDDKILVSWNALMIDSLARAAGVLNDPWYAEAAARAARFLLEEVRRPDGRLLHSWRHGRARFDAYLDDYSYLINALVSLYQADFDESWIDAAVQLADLTLNHFADPDGGGFFYTADDHETLIARNKDWSDSSVPGGNSMAATALLRLGKLCGRTDYLQAAGSVVEITADFIERAPSAMGQMLIAADMRLGPMPEIVIVGDAHRSPTAEVLGDLRQRYLPNHVLACRGPERAHESPALQAVFEGKPMVQEPTVYICENFTCQAPLAGPEAARKAWEQLAET